MLPVIPILPFQSLPGKIWLYCWMNERRNKNFLPHLGPRVPLPSQLCWHKSSRNVLSPGRKLSLSQIWLWRHHPISLCSWVLSRLDWRPTTWMGNASYSVSFLSPVKPDDNTHLFSSEATASRSPQQSGGCYTPITVWLHSCVTKTYTERQKSYTSNAILLSRGPEIIFLISAFY